MKDGKDLKETISRYGQFIPTFDAWLPIEKQKKQAKKMENITDNKQKKQTRKDK